MTANRPVRASEELTVIIINYNGARFLDELLSGLADQSVRGFKSVMIDNCSADQSCSLVERRYPWVQLSALEENLGFAAAANLGVLRSETRFVVLLNADIRLDRDWLSGLLESAHSAEDVSAVASKMRLYDKPHVLNGVGGAMNRLGYTWDRGMNEEDRGQFDTPAEVLFASAGAALFRRSAFLESGGFDERFFMYHEDVDLGWRLWLLGHRIITAPGAVVYHHFGASTRAARSMRWRELLGERNNIRSLLKNYGLYNLRKALAELLLLRQSPRRKLGQLRNFAWNAAFLPDTIRLRRRIQRRRVRSDEDLIHLIEQRNDVPVHL